MAGTTSDAGKSTVVAALCRWLARRGVRVAPFKAQNMSNNSMVCPDGSEIGRAQWLQAVAAGAEPESAMNPVLLKPGGDRRSHIVFRGTPWGELGSGDWESGRQVLAEAAYDALAELRSRYDVVICEGAGSPAELNLRDGDYVNMGLARRADLPVVVVGDIDRGGVLAAMAGTLALLDAEDQQHLAGFLVNKFRGDVELLRPGLDSLVELTARPVLAVLPWLEQAWIDSEDTLALSGGNTPHVPGALTVAMVRFPRVSNATDLDALAAEPGVSVEVTTDPDVVAAADLAVLPGTRATVDDLTWLRSRGIDTAVHRRVVDSRPVLAICGGYQMLAETISDDVESGAGTVDGLGVLPLTVTFDEHKTLTRPCGRWREHEVSGYEIHHGTVRTSHEELDSFPGGCQRGNLWATMWHGAFESDGFRRAWLSEIAAAAGSDWAPRPERGFAARRDDMLERLANAVDEHADTAALLQLIEQGASAELPVVRLTSQVGNNDGPSAVGPGGAHEANEEGWRRAALRPGDHRDRFG